MMSTLEVTPYKLETQQAHFGVPFPLVLHPGDGANGAKSVATLGAVESWLSEQRDAILEQTHQHGAILFRGFPLESPDDFDRFIAALGLENFPYDESFSNAVRINYTPRVFSANEAPSEVTICLHHEMAQTPIFPRMLLFYCQQPAAEGGATPLCRSDVLYQRMVQQCPGFASDCETKGLRYTNVMPHESDAASGMGRSWRATLRAESKEEAESRMSEFGYTWQWLAHGLRATTPVLPAVREASSGRKTFFNQFIAATQGWKTGRNDPSNDITFGDGGPIDEQAALQVAEIAEDLTFDVPWRQGDVALIDNILVMHGRRTFAGTRRVLASLVEPSRHDCLN